jgi:hypothetical protein
MVLEDYREGSTMATCKITLRTQKLLKTTFYISKLQQLLLNKEQRIHSFLTLRLLAKVWRSILEKKRKRNTEP